MIVVRLVVAFLLKRRDARDHGVVVAVLLHDVGQHAVPLEQLVHPVVHLEPLFLALDILHLDPVLKVLGLLPVIVVDLLGPLVSCILLLLRLRHFVNNFLLRYLVHLWHRTIKLLVDVIVHHFLDVLAELGQPRQVPLVVGYLRLVRSDVIIAVLQLHGEDWRQLLGELSVASLVHLFLVRGLVVRF